MAEGTLYLAATPIGNLGDISQRLAETLRDADIIYAEDTRRTSILLRHIGAETPMRSLFAGNERERSEELLADLSRGMSVVLVSDAGMPSISDPGSHAVSRAREAGHIVTVVPGPSAVTAAVAVAGFGGDRFVFDGFLPRTGRARRQRLEGIAEEQRVVVVFATPHRLSADLADLRDVCGPDRRLAVVRELTKLHEEVWTGTMEEAVKRWSEPVKGELTLVLAPVVGELVGDFDTAVERARLMIGEGASPSTAARRAADETGVPRREIYQALIERA